MSQHGDIATGPGWELRCGRWQDVLSDVEAVDAVITDPPYSERTDSGIRGMAAGAKGEILNPMHYANIGPADAIAIATAWSGRGVQWAIVCGDHIAWQWHESAWQDAGWYTFAPVPMVRRNPVPRFAADGPCSACDYWMVARPRSRVARPASRPGWYIAKKEPTGVIGSKSIDHMRAIVRDYSAPGDLICEPYAGSGSTLLAAVMEGRRVIGAEMDPDTFDLAVKRLRKGYTPDLFTEAAPDAPAAAKQLDLGGGDE